MSKMANVERKNCIMEGCDNVATSKGSVSKGSGMKSKKRYSKLCSTHRKNRYKDVEKIKCAICGFIAVHKAQLDIDHIDGNRLNHDPANLQVLCANCHRLKTMENEDHLS